ncbi:hypothetical protein M422DRAFT_77985, partial [Sphaerobolus stellatus SS14]
EDGTKTEKAKRGFDETGLPWFGKPDPILDPRIKKTLERKRYYLSDPKQVKQSLLGRADCPPFPDSLWLDVISGKYIDLDKVCAGRFSLAPESSLVQSIGDIDITVRGNGSAGRPTKQVQSVADWTLAFRSAKAAILFLYEERADELNTYEEFIMGQFSAMRTSEHRRVIELDKAIRKQAASFNNCTYSTIPNFNGLVTQYLNTIGLGSSNSYGSNSTVPTSNKRRREDNQDKQICRRFNRNQCVRACKFRHICIICEGSHQAKECG